MMPRSSRALAIAVALVPLLAPLGVASAQLSRAHTVNGVRIAAPKSTLIRADAPIPGSGLADPSLANAYDFTTPSGTNLNGVGNFIIPDPEDPRFIFTCTATRIGAHSILTAAHCVTDDQTGALLSTSQSSFARFLMPGSTDATPKWYYTSGQSQVVVNPLWQGFNNPNTYLFSDMAVVNFDYTLPSWITTYGLYTADPLDQATEHVGYGTYGGGVGPTDFDYGRRWGTNVVDYIETDPGFSDFLDLYTDFDDPAGDYDTFCLFGICSAHDPNTEAGTAPGDSGGPLFINGMLAGVTSFGTYVCDPFLSTNTTCVPFVADQSRPFDAFGSLHGFSPVFANTDFITSAMAPEPGTIVLMMTGLLAIGGIARRRRSS